MPKILKKLPEEIRKNLRIVCGTSTWVLSELKSSLLEEIKVLDEGQDTDEIQMTHRDQGPQHKNASVNLISEFESCETVYF